MNQQVAALDSARKWLCRCEHVRSAAIFGSTAKMLKDGGVAKSRNADIDVHIVAPNTRWVDNLNWNKEIKDGELCLVASRAATGRVRKWSIVYSSMQLDMVIVPAIMMYAARLGFGLGLHRRMRVLREALNEMASCLRLGYVFVKGERQWGAFYRSVSLLPGVRLADAEVVQLANSAVCDCLWVLQKLEGGEVTAAQHVLHSRVVDANLRLLREVRIRESLPLPSFGLGRNLETLLESCELASVRVNSLANAHDLERATRRALDELQSLVYRLSPRWTVSPEMAKLVAVTGPSSHHP